MKTTKGLGALEMLLKSGLLRPDRKGDPRIIAVETPQENNLIYYGQIVIEDAGHSLAKADIEEILHNLKHCFNGDYQKVLPGQVEYFREHTSRHSRLSVTYTVALTASGMTITFHRSTAEGGAHMLRKVTEENKTRRRYVYYNEEPYYVIPLKDAEANRLMVLFSSMAVDAIEAHILEKGIGSECYDDIVLPEPL